jgi:hypothetical protein
MLHYRRVLRRTREFDGGGENAAGERWATFVAIDWVV